MSTPAANLPVQPFHVITKPIGPACNLRCKYCFYLEKESLFPANETYRMSEAVLERFVEQYIGANPGPEINFAWQGGEPTLLGVDFFRRVVELQKKYCPEEKTVSNSFQTNAILFDETWCEFLRENRFLVGVSIDGPRQVHDAFRRDAGGKGSHARVMKSIRLLKKEGVEFNTLSMIQNRSAKHPLEIYRFLREHGSGFMQFIPMVERAAPDGMGYAQAPDLRTVQANREPAAGCVSPEDFGNFLCTIFDEWVRNDVANVFVRIIDVQLGLWMGYPASLCVFAETCGRGVALEHNGDLYACDHFVYPDYRLGSVLDGPLEELVNSEQQTRFGNDKRDALPRQCRECDVLFACRGGCPKHRYAVTDDGEPGLNYLCAGYKQLFHHMDPHMRTMARLLRSQRPAAEIMTMLAQSEGRAVAPPAEPAGPSRNRACPCGSNKKYKHCCGKA